MWVSVLSKGVSLHISNLKLESGIGGTLKQNKVCYYILICLKRVNIKMQCFKTNHFIFLYKYAHKILSILVTTEVSRPLKLRRTPWRSVAKSIAK